MDAFRVAAASLLLFASFGAMSVLPVVPEFAVPSTLAGIVFGGVFAAMEIGPITVRAFEAFKRWIKGPPTGEA